MRLFTQDEQQQWHYLGDYDIVPQNAAAPRIAESGSAPAGRRRLGNLFSSPLFRRYKKTVGGMVIGLVIGILFITIGFFKTLFLAILIGAGFVVGGFFDRNPIVLKFLDSIG